MREFELPGRSVAVGSKGMVATSNPQAALVGLDVLRSGGNAVDAAVAIAAMLGVVEPTQTGIGGDCFVLLKKRGHDPIALNGAGWAPKAIDVSRLRESGETTISMSSAHAITVPGAVAAWELLLEDYGTRALGELLTPAIKAAEEGYLVTERLSRDWGRYGGKMSATPEAKEIFMPGNVAPKLGDRRTNLPLARALRAIADQGAEVFYRGWIADDIVALARRYGGTHHLDDFAEYRPEYVHPICTDYRGYTLWECPPSGQGIVALQIAAFLNKFDVASLGPLTVERFHLQAEAARIGYAYRDALLCDVAFGDCDFTRFLQPSRIAELVRKFDPKQRASSLPVVKLPEHKDTVYISVVDAEGTVVSFINSIFDDFGSGFVAPKSGVLLHNRGCGFTLEPGHPNVIAGRKRPMHTIIPALLTKNGVAVMSFGCTGGHFQPAGQLQVLSNIVDFGMSIQAAIDYPRMFARADSFEVEQTVPMHIWTGLRKLGHAPRLTENPLGTCHAIWIDYERGVLLGGADGRRDSIAIGY